MKKKLQFLLSMVALMLVSFVARAQNPGDDVTETYITNWDFTGCSNGNFPGWVISAPNAGNTWVHGATAVEYWNNNLSANFDYYQVVNLPAGKYQISASMWNTQGTVTGESGVYGTSLGTSVFAGVTDDCDDTNLHTYTTEVITVIDGTLRVGVKNNAARKAQWFGVDWIKLTYMGSLEISDYANVLASVVASANAVEADVPTSVYSALQTVVSENSKTYDTADEYEAAIKAINDAVEATAPFTTAKPKLDAMKALVDANNFVTAAATEEYYGQWAAKFEAGTLTNTEAQALQDPTVVTAWHAPITVDNYLLSTWDTNPDFEDAPYYINTWSVEGETDGTEFKTPFFEYWTADANSLGEKTLTATLEDVTPGTYEVNAWVRVRAKNGTAATDATGITLSANDGEAIDVTEGEAVGQFNIKKYTATATVNEDGKLKIQFNVAADNNISWLSFKNVKYVQVTEPAAAIVNAEFNPAAEPIGWEKVNPEQYYDFGMGVLGTYSVNAGASDIRNTPATVDETHFATEYCAGFECRWQTNYAAYTQTTANLSAGYYKLTYDVENVNGATISANYENRFTVTVGDQVYTDESTEWMKGKSAWTTHSIDFAIDEAAPITISLGYGTGSNNYGVANTPVLYVSHLQLTTADPIVEAKAKAIAKIEALTPVGDALFQYAQANLDAAKAAVDAASTVEEVKAVEIPTQNAPDPEQAYAIANKTAEGNLSIEEGAITVKKDAAVYFTAVEGGFVLSNENDEYIVKTTGNTWTLSTTTDIAEAYVVNFNTVEGGYTIQGANGLFGLDNTDEGSTVYANKAAADNGIWTIEAISEEEPVAEDEVKDLTADMFYTWDGYGADATSISVATVDFNVGSELSAGSTVAGTSTVDYLTYADLTGSTKLIFEGAAGTPIRVLMNRQESNDGPLVEKNPTIGEDGKAELDLTDLAYVHLNAIKIAWSSPGTITSIKFVKPSDPLAIPKEALKTAIAKGKLQDAVAKTEESFSALTEAIAAGEAALAAADATAASLETATTAINNAIAGLVLADGYSNLTAGIFKQYASLEEPGEGTPVAGAPLELGTASDLPYGDGNVSELKWADLTDYDALVITIAGDVKARLCMNRLEANGQQAETKEESKMLDINPNNDFTWSTKAYQTVDGNTYTIDLAKIVEDYGYARLHCIKKQGYGAGVVVTGLYLYKAPEAAPTYAITIADTENGTVEADVEEAEEGATVTLTVTPDEGYELEAITVTDAEDSDVEVGEGYTFIMPASAVNVSATFTEVAVEPETPSIAATLVHTASSSCGGTAGEFTSTLDAETEHVNNSNFNNTWAGAAYAEFSTANLSAGATITKATLTFTGIGESRRARDTQVLYVNAGQTLDYDAIEEGSANVNLAATDLQTVSFPQSTSQSFDIDVTDALKAILAEQNYIIFKWTGNPGGGDVAGKASENAPTLVIEYIPGAPEIANASFELDGEKSASNAALEITGWTFSTVGNQFNNTELRPSGSTSTTSQFGTSDPSDGEYSLYFRQGWNGDGNTFTITSAALTEIPAGDYVLSVDYKQRYSYDNTPNDNTKVGIALVNGTTTLASETSPAAGGESGGSAGGTYFNTVEWSTLTASFTLDEPVAEGAQVVITLYAGGQRRSDFFLDNVTLEKVPGIELALIELKKAIEAAEAKKATYSVGDGLFQYPESEIAPLTTMITAAQSVYDAAESKEAVEAAIERLNTTVETFAPVATTPDPAQQYILTLQTSDASSPFELNVSTDGIRIVAAEEGTPVTFVAQQDGTYAIFNGTYYVNYEGSNNWTVAATAVAYGWTIAALTDGGYSITGKNGLLGTNTSDGNAAGSSCYGDKKTTNGNYIWNFTEYTAPAPVAIDGIASEGKAKENGKYLENGQIVIFRDGKKFSTTGVELK